MGALFLFSSNAYRRGELQGKHGQFSDFWSKIQLRETKCDMKEGFIRKSDDGAPLRTDIVVYEYIKSFAKKVTPDPLTANSWFDLRPKNW